MGGHAPVFYAAVDVTGHFEHSAGGDLRAQKNDDHNLVKSEPVGHTRIVHSFGNGDLGT